MMDYTYENFWVNQLTETTVDGDMHPAQGIHIGKGAEMTDEEILSLFLDHGFFEQEEGRVHHTTGVLLQRPYALDGTPMSPQAIIMMGEFGWHIGINPHTTPTGYFQWLDDAHGTDGVNHFAWSGDDPNTSWGSAVEAAINLIRFTGDYTCPEDGWEAARLQMEGK